MKYIINIALIASLLTFSGCIGACTGFTKTQTDLLRQAAVHGKVHDLSLTLMAITWQEGFVGPYVVRVNASDGKWGSYGITSISLEYAMEAQRYTNPWKAKQDLVPMLMIHDPYAFSLAIKKLLQYKSRGWRGMVKKYNGTGQMAEKYLQSIVKKVNILRQCNLK